MNWYSNLSTKDPWFIDTVCVICQLWFWDWSSSSVMKKKHNLFRQKDYA